MGFGVKKLFVYVFFLFFCCLIENKSETDRTKNGSCALTLDRNYSLANQLMASLVL